MHAVLEENSEAITIRLNASGLFRPLNNFMKHQPSSMPPTASTACLYQDSCFDSFMTAIAFSIFSVLPTVLGQ